MSESQSIRLDLVKVKDLHAFACDFFAKPDGQVTSPTTIPRALAQSKNPYADADDIGLVIAYAGKQCVGYGGILPGVLKSARGITKIYWPSSIYVLPEWRRRQVAQKIVERWILLGEDLAATGTTDSVARLYLRLGFREPKPLRLIAVKLDAINPAVYPFKLLQKAMPKSTWAKNAATGEPRRVRDPWYAAALNLYHRALAARAERALDGLRAEEVREVRPLNGGADDYAPVPYFHRGLEVINWMLQYSWFVEGGKPVDPPYYFGGERELFRYIALEIRADEQGCDGFVVLSVCKTQSRATLKLLDYRMRDAALREKLFWLACRYAAKYKVDRIELPDCFASFTPRLPLANRVVAFTERRYFFYPCRQDSPLAQAMDAVTLDCCDCDMAFY